MPDYDPETRLFQLCGEPFESRTPDVICSRCSWDNIALEIDGDSE